MSSFSLIGRLAPFLGREGVSVLASNPYEPHHLLAGSLEGSLSVLDLNAPEGGSRWINAEGGVQQSSAVTDATFVSGDPKLVASSSRDGTVGVYDIRLPPPASRVTSIRVSLDRKEAEAWSVDVGGTGERMVACSIESQVHLYDLRAATEIDFFHKNRSRAERSRALGNTRIATLAGAHGDIVNVVRFHPERRALLFTGADDNLICVTDTSRVISGDDLLPPPEIGKEEVKEETAAKKSDAKADQQTASIDDDGSSYSDTDDAIIFTIQNDSPPRLLAFAGPHFDVVCSLSTTETVQAWHMPGIAEHSSVTPGGDASFDEAVAEFRKAYRTTNLRHPASPSTIDSPSASDDDALPFAFDPLIQPISMNQDPSEYGVSFLYDDASERLFVLGGTHEGALHLYHLNCEGRELVSTFNCGEGGSAHTGSVRAGLLIQCGNLQNPILTTGSEDGSICLWRQ